MTLSVNLTDDFVEVLNEKGLCLLCADKSDDAISFLERACEALNAADNAPITKATNT